MKILNIKTLSGLASVGLLASLLSACGAPHPFSRGEWGNFSVNKDGEVVNPNLPSGPTEEFFNNHVLPALTNDCKACHGQKFLNYSASLKRVKANEPQNSKLYIKATGLTDHGGGAVWEVDSQEARLMRSWILGS